MKKTSVALSQDLNTSTPSSTQEQNLWNNNIRIRNNGWRSERVALPSSSSTVSTSSGYRHVSSISLSPFSSGRALPSKWDEAERWICSPAGTEYSNVAKALHYGKPQSLSHRRPKSKSGPIVPPRNMFFSGYSTMNSIPVVQGPSVKNYMMSSPLLTGVLQTNGVYTVGNSSAGVAPGTSIVVPISYLQEQSEELHDVSLSNSQGEKRRRTENAESKISDSHGIQQLDMEDERSSSIHDGAKSSIDGAKSSIKEVPSFPCHQEDSESCNPKLEFRDVLVDRGTTGSRMSKKHLTKEIKENLRDAKHCEKDLADPKASSSNIVGEAIKISKLETKEDKITVWENLQKANAEAEIRKLEMKLEKKKSSSMDKILDKLRRAQMKAQKMRSSLAENESEHTTHLAPRNPRIKAIFKHIFIASLRRNSCINCDAL